MPEMETKFEIQDPKTPWMPKKGDKVAFCYDWVDRNTPSYKIAAGTEGTVEAELPYTVKANNLTVVVDPSHIRPVRKAVKAQMTSIDTPDEKYKKWQEKTQVSPTPSKQAPIKQEPIKEAATCTCPPGHACPANCPAECTCPKKTAGCMASIKFPSEKLKNEAIAILQKAGFVKKAFTPSDIQEQSPIDQKEVRHAPPAVEETPETWKKWLQLKKKYENMGPSTSQTYSGEEYAEYRKLKNYYDQQSNKSTYTDETFRQEGDEYTKTASKKKSDFEVGDIVVNTVAWKNLPKNTKGVIKAATEHFLEIKFASSDTPFAFTGDYLDTLKRDIEYVGNSKDVVARVSVDVNEAKRFWKSAGLIDVVGTANEFKSEFEQYHAKKVTEETKWDFINFIAPRVAKKIEHYSASLKGYKNDDGTIYKIAMEDLVYENSIDKNEKKVKAVDNERINRYERERQIERLLSRTRHIGAPFKGNDVVFAPNDQPTGTNPNHPMASPREPEYWVEKAFVYLAKKHYQNATDAYKGIIGCDEAKHMSPEQKERLKRLMISYGLAVEC